MNEIINKFLLVGDKFMPEMHLKQPGFTYSACGQRNPNKIWVVQISEFNNNTFQDFLKINNIEVYSTCSEGKSVVADRFIRTLKNKIFKHMTVIFKKCLF